MQLKVCLLGGVEKTCCKEPVSYSCKIQCKDAAGTWQILFKRKGKEPEPVEDAAKTGL